MAERDETALLGELRERFGTARRPGRAADHSAPDVDAPTIEAIGKLSAALETVEAARGHLYAFHRMSGTADLEVQGAVDALRSAGHDQVADTVSELLVGRDIIDGMWSFQLVERYDEQYWQVVRATERSVRAAVGITEPHVFEAGMKQREQSEPSP